MTEISASIELSHSVDLVWRALTEPPLLARWFVEADLRPRVGATFRLHAPAGDPAVTGFDATTLVEVKVVEAPHRLVMTWRSDQLHTTVTWTLWPGAAGGCRLDVSQVGFLGVRGTSRRDALRATYERLYGERLPALLAELAGGPPANLPPLVAAGSVRSRPPALVIALAALVAVAVAGTVVAFTVGGSSPPVVAGDDRPLAAVTLTPSASATTGGPRTGSPTPTRSRTRGPVESATSSAAPRPPAPPATTGGPTGIGPAKLGATYRLAGQGLFTYTGAIKVTNSGGAAAPAEVLVTLPSGASVTDATASYSQSGERVTFTLPPIGGGAAAEFTFDVFGGDERKPTGCSVSGVTCGGL